MWILIEKLYILSCCSPRTLELDAISFKSDRKASLDIVEGCVMWALIDIGTVFDQQRNIDEFLSKNWIFYHMMLVGHF